MKLLHIDSSILGDNSVSRELSAAIVATQKALHPDLQVVSHDLATDPLDHLTVAHIGALQGALPEEEALRRDVVAGQNALDEFLNADIVVIGAPMYNFSIPSQLKAWIDRVSVAGRSFRYTENGPEGLAGGKTLFIASSRGGAYGEASGIAFLDHQEAYLRSVFGFLGVTDVRFIRAENLARGPELRAQALEAAHGEIQALHGVALAA